MALAVENQNGSRQVCCGVKSHVTTGTMRCTWTLICKGSKGNAAQLWSINDFSIAFLATLTLSPYLSSPEPSSGRENRWWFSRVWLQYENIPVHYNLCYVFQWSGLWRVCDVWVSFPVHRFYSSVPGTVWCKSADVRRESFRHVHHVNHHFQRFIISIAVSVLIVGRV